MINQVHIRYATKEDVNLILSNELQAHHSPWSEASLNESVDGEHLVWVMEYDDQIIGHLVVLPVLDEWELLNVVIKPCFQGKKLGRTWIEHLISQAKESSIKKIFLEVRKSNHIAISLYDRFGFWEIGLRKAYYPSDKGREDALVMQITV
ncbi:ribosomal protein S18-alanine N-acetyltransferase [Aliikangiella maris]|uniref:[Ribosomal protein bS18]-alanine N-acetyltransferase n=2 Tax=Aliikangiella maris TaxID=3162458 RepID=A0ABV2BTQ9_9GAMM